MSIGLDKEKYKCIIMYIASLKGNIGKTQLSKILFFIDIEYYKEHKKTMTSDIYIKNNYGPTPKNVKTILEEMQNERSITFIETKSSNNPSNIKEVLTMTSNLSEAYQDLHLKISEADLIKRFYKYCEKKSSDELKNETHTSVYHSLDMHVDIPNFMLPYYFNEEFTEEEKINLRLIYN